MSRFVIEGFSSDAFWGSDSGAVLPLPLRLSVLETAATERPFCEVVGLVTGDPMAEEVCETEGEGVGFWAESSRCAATVAIASR